MTEYGLHSPFDPQLHSETFINYLEVIIDEFGNVEYAIPSHQEAMMRKAIQRTGKTRQQIEDECPKEYYCNYMAYLSKLSGCISVWNEFFEGDEPNEAQMKTLKDLKELNLYKGELSLSEPDYAKSIYELLLNL